MMKMALAGADKSYSPYGFGDMSPMNTLWNQA
jgi:hypothetical protein